MRVNPSKAAFIFPPLLKVPPSQLAARLAFCNRTAHIRGDNCPPKAITRIDWLRPDVHVREAVPQREVAEVDAAAPSKPAAALDDARKPYAPPPLAKMPPSHDRPPPPQQVAHLDNYPQVTNRGSLIDALA